jgi:ACS family hexuronate transporter-like MFS transporter
MIPSSTKNHEVWKWSVCGMLFLATMLNYMDRQTLSQTILRIKPELGLDEVQYGYLESFFGYAFACGGLFFGFLADRVRIYWLYPLLILCWSIIGFASAYAVDIGAWLGGTTLKDQAFRGFCLCRTALGFVEAAQWPFALVTTSRLLSRGERSLGNGILQSGTAIGSIVTPLVVQLLVTDEQGTWRMPFMVIGVVGLGWIGPWFLLMKPSDLSRPATVVATSADAPATGVAASETTAAKLAGAVPLPTSSASSEEVAASKQTAAEIAAAASEETAAKRDAKAASLPPDVFWRRFIVCAVMVVSLNLPWHFYRAWLPQYLDSSHGYSRTAINYFTAGYYAAAFIGCLGIGFLARWLVVRGWDVHVSRLTLFGLCAAAVAVGVVAALMPTGGVLLGLLLIVGAAGLGLFPNYYAYTQDLSGRHQGKISGVLGFTTWTATGVMHPLIGGHVKETQSYAEPMTVLSLAPIFAFVVLLLVWKQWPPKQETAV